MTIWRFNSCPRCQGAMWSDSVGEWHCLQCGHIVFDVLVPFEKLPDAHGGTGVPRSRAPAWHKYNKGGKVGRPGKV